MKNKTIYALMDTDRLAKYIESDLEFYGLATDSDNRDIPESVRNSAMAEVIHNATDGRLSNEIAEVFSDSYGREVLDRVYEVIDDFVYNEVNKVLKRSKSAICVKAYADLQQWVGDWAYTSEETDVFDCHAALDAFNLSDLPPYADWIHERGYCNYGDEIWFECTRIGLEEEWDGPFEFYITDDDAYEAYIDDRVRREYGCELRS